MRTKFSNTSEGTTSPKADLFLGLNCPPGDNVSYRTRSPGDSAS